MSWRESLLTLGKAAIRALTGLPAPLINRITSGLPTRLSRESKTKLYNAYRRENYRALRESGATVKEARKVQSAAPEKVRLYTDMRSRDFSDREIREVFDKPTTEAQKYLQLRNSGATVMEAETYSQVFSQEQVDQHSQQLLEYAAEIAKGNGIKLEDILRGMRLSDKTIDEWETYVSDRKKQSWVPLQQYDLKLRQYIPVDSDSMEMQNWLAYRNGEQTYTREYSDDSDLPF